jgi:hypothetical protein
VEQLRLRERERREVCRRLNLIEAELAAQLLDSYSGRGPVEFWTSVERFKLFLEMSKALCG